MSIIGKLGAIISAAEAGWIASGCKTGCVIDDDEQEIIPCEKHATRIHDLAVKNKRRYEA